MTGSLGIIALVPDEWRGIVTSRHCVLPRLARYYPVVWVEPARNWREFFKPWQASFLATDRWSEPCPSLSVLTAGWQHPDFFRTGPIRTATLRSRLALARARLVDRGATRIALYIWRDEFAEALDLVDHDFSVYHVDDEYSFSAQDLPTSEREVNLLRRVDQVIVHSKALFDKKGGVNPNTTLIPNGVDYRSYSTPREEPADMASIAHPRIGYAGVVKKHMDFELLIRLATARPQWSFVIVGMITNIEGKERQVATLRRMRNVHFLGGKPARELPAYIQHFDVCLMCYEVNGYTRYIYPLKLYEYLASGRPAVSSPIGPVQDFSDVVSIADGDDEWLTAIEHGFDEGARDGIAASARQAVARASDWEIRVERIAAVFALAGAVESPKRPGLLQAAL